MAQLPDFTDAGLLPPGDYVLTIEELRQSMLVTGPAGDADWDVTWRRELVDRLDSILKDLWALGIEYVVVDGSFVERKGRPGDIDAYFPITEARWRTRELERGLNQRRGEDVWTWDPDRSFFDPESGKKKLPSWHKYRIELFPDYGQAADARGSAFATYFRQTRAGTPKGVAKVLRVVE